MSKLIGLCGKMGVGKSTVVELMTDGTVTENIKFAEPLYDMQEYIYKRISKAYKRPDSFVKDRKLLQWLGTEFGRQSISDSLWIDLWKAEVKYAIENYPSVTVTCDDVRFNNEAEALKSLGGKLILVTSNKTQDRIDTKSGITGHASEGGIDFKYVDYVLENNGTVDDLKKSVKALLAKID